MASDCLNLARKTHETMKFSIVIPVYNTQEDYIIACVESVINQSMKDYEIIIVDDGSNQQTKRILHQIVERYSGLDISIVSQDNRGLLQARRTGFARVQGDYCLSLDSDDMLRSDALEKITAVLKANRADLVLFNASRSLNYNESLYDYSQYPGLLSDLSKITVLDALCGSADGCFNNMALKAFKKELLENCQDYTKYGRLQYGEDLLQSAELIDLSKNIILLDENLYFYRPAESSITRSFYRNRLEDIKVVHKELRNKAREWDKTFNCTSLEEKITVLDLVNIYAYLLSAANVSKQEAIEAFSSVREDPYFIAAWSNIAACSMLTMEKRFAMSLLFQKKYSALLAYAKCVHLAKQLRSCFVVA